MSNRKVSLFQLHFLFVFLLVLSIGSAYSTDKIPSKDKIEKLITMINRTDSLISIKKKKLTELRSDRKKARQDSIALKKRYKDKLSALNKDAKRIDSLSIRCVDELAEISSQIDKTTQDNVGTEKKKSDALSALNREKEHLDSLMAAMKKEDSRLDKEHETTRDDRSNIVKDYGKKVSVFQQEISQRDRLIAVETKEKNKLTSRQKKLELDNLIEIKKKELTNLMAMGQEIRTEKSGAFKTTQRELGELMEQQKKMMNTPDIAQWEKSESNLSPTQRKTRLDSLMKEKENALTVLSKQREEITQDSLTAHNDFQTTIQQVRGKLASLDSAKIKAKETTATCEKKHNKFKSDSVAIVKLFMDDSKKTKKAAGHQESLASKKKKELEVFENQRKKLRIDSLSLQEEKVKAIQQAQQQAAKLDQLISEKEKELTELDMIKKKSETSLQLKITQVDGFITQNEKTLISLITDSDKFRQNTITEREKNSEREHTALQKVTSQDNLIQEQEKKLDKLHENIKKLRQDSIVTKKEINTSIQVRDKAKDEYSTLQKKNTRSDSLAQNKITMQDNLISKTKKENTVLAKMLNSVLKGTAYQQKAEPKRKQTKALHALENIYRLLWNGKAKDAKAQFSKENKLLKKNLNTKTYNALSTSIDIALKQPKKGKVKKKPVRQPEPVTLSKPLPSKSTVSKAKQTVKETTVQDTKTVKPVAPKTEESVADVKTDKTEPLSTIKKEEEIVAKRDATIFISTIPPRALVYMDGKLIGRSNYEYLKVMSGTHDITFILNTISCERKMTFKPGKNPSVLIRIPCKK